MSREARAFVLLVATVTIAVTAGMFLSGCQTFVYGRCQTSANGNEPCAAGVETRAYLWGK